MPQAELAEAKQIAKQGQALAKRVIVVCGGASGIGPDIASRLFKEGAKVVVVDEDAASAKGKVRGGMKRSRLRVVFEVTVRALTHTPGFVSNFSRVCL